MAFEKFGGKNGHAYIDQLLGETVKGGKPFCLFACSNEPHSPWDKGDASVYPGKNKTASLHRGYTGHARDLF